MCHAGTYPLKMARTDYILGCVTVMLPPIAEWGYVSPLPRANAETSTRKKIPRWLTKLSLFFFFRENEQRCKTLPILYFTWPLSQYNAHIHRCRGRGQIVANRNHKQKNRNGSFPPSSSDGHWNWDVAIEGQCVYVLALLWCACVCVVVWSVCT